MPQAVPIITAVAAAAGAGTAIYSAVQGAPKVPAVPQPGQSPTVDAFRKKNAAAMLPGAALAGNSSTLSGAGAGPSQSVGTSTLLGQ